MNFYPIHAGRFKLDGGAMFGVVPKTLWSRNNPADSNNMCPWSMRCLLIEDGDRLMLIDNGIGNKQDEKFFSYYFLHGEESLESSLNAAGISKDDITDVFLTHLHFDHCGGSITRNENGTLVPAFKNATFWSNEDHWKWATEPNKREKASFLKENILPIQESGQLKFIDSSQEILKDAFPNMDVFFANGHTDKQMIPLIKHNGKTIAFMADLLPSTGHIPMAWVMGYDTRPLLTLEEKERFLKMAAKEEFVMFLEHDYYNECCTVHETEKGIRLNETFDLKEIL